MDVKTHVTPVPNDSHTNPGWVVREYIGSQILKADSPTEFGEDGFAKYRISSQEALAVGDKIRIPGFSGYYLMIVESIDGPCGFAKTLDGSTGSDLIFGGDDRNCWVSGCLINMSSLGKAP